MHILIFLLLLIPSLCFGAATDSNVALSGNSMYVADNAALEQSGNSYFACGVRYQKNTTTNAADMVLFGKFNNALTERSWMLYIGNAAGAYKPKFYVDKLGNATIFSNTSPPNNYANDLNIHTIVGQWFGNLPTNSGVTEWVDGNVVATISNSAVNNVYDGAASLTVGADAYSNAINFNGRIYQAWIAYADTPIITADSAVTAWTLSPTQANLPFSGVSRAFYWGPDGTYTWKSGSWKQTSPPIYENFLDGWIETDAAAYVTPYATSVAFTDLPRNATSHLVNDFGAGYFGTSLTHSFTHQITAETGTVGTVALWGLSNHAATNPYSWTDGIVLYRYADTPRIQLRNRGSKVDSSIITLPSELGVYSAVVTRDATNTTANIYLSGVSVASVVVASGATGFQYQYVAGSYNDGAAGKTVTGTISNLDLLGGQTFNLDFVGNPRATRWRPTNPVELDRGPGFPSHWERFAIP